MSSNSFIQKLLLRLKSGDARSIHLNALPGNFARLDIYDLANIEPGLHLRFLELLLSKNTFRFPITIEPSLLNEKKEEHAATDKKKILQKLIRRLNHIDYQEKEQFSEHGYHSFGFGYPLLIKRDPNNPDRILKAPLLIWYLDIEKDRQKNNTWTISRNEDHPLVFNELLRSHFESVEKIRTDDLEEWIEDDLIDEAGLNLFCKKVLEKLNVPFNETENIATILPCTNKETIESISGESPWIRWSGVFGLYKMQKQSIIKDLQNLLETEMRSGAENESREAVYFDGEVLTPVLLDPSQENVLQQLKQSNKVVIQGPPGTGKSQSLSAIITQALLNRQKVLVVCEKRTAMEVLYNNLKKEDLHHLCALIEDVYTDRKHIVEHVRNSIEEAGQAPLRFRSHDYELLRTRFLSLQEEINHRINFTNQLVFGDDTWMELLSKSSDLNEDKKVLEMANSLNRSLRNSDYDFTYEEYNLLSEKIAKALELFRKVDPAALIFREMDALVFKEENSAETISNDLKKIHQRSVLIQESIVKNKERYADGFNNLKGISSKVTSVLAAFFSKYKMIRKEQSGILSEYIQLNNYSSGKKYFSFESVAIEGMEKMEGLLPSLRSIEDRSQRFLQQLHLSPDLFNFQKFYVLQDVKTQALIEALMNTNSREWQLIFTTYYINQVLLKTALRNGIKDDTQRLFEALQETDLLLKQKLREKIRYTWQEMINETLKNRDLSEIKYLYNQRKNKMFSSKNSLRKIIHSDFDLFSTLFPVLMVNPSVAASLLPLKEHLFDLIILDEASQLRLEDTYSSLIRGKTKIISGDRHQMPPSNFFGNDVVFWNEEEEEMNAEDFLAESKSLLEYADDAAYTSSYLDYHYRSLHPDLIRFSNHAFYQSRLIPLPEREDYLPIRYVHVGGLYHEGVNADEARAIVRFIYSLEAAHHELPSIGIATFNIYQRDLIFDELYEQAYADKEKNDKLQALLNKGLFVKNLENIQGDERDIMILSTTFGTDEQGKFRQAFGPLTQEKGYQLLNVIITRARHSLYVFTSIPEQVFMNFSEELKQKGNTGKSIFYAYLSYVKAVSEENGSQKEFIRQALQQNSKQYIFRNKEQSGIFRDRVFAELKKEWGDALRQNYKLGGFNLDIVLLKEEKPFLYIDFENILNYHPEVSYRIKLHQQKIADDYGIKVYHLWSYNWWSNAAQEIENISRLYRSYAKDN